MVFQGRRAVRPVKARTPQWNVMYAYLAKHRFLLKYAYPKREYDETLEAFPQYGCKFLVTKFPSCLCCKSS